MKKVIFNQYCLKSECLIKGKYEILQDFKQLRNLPKTATSLVGSGALALQTMLVFC